MASSHSLRVVLLIQQPQVHRPGHLCQGSVSHMLLTMAHTTSANGGVGHMLLTMAAVGREMVLAHTCKGNSDVGTSKTLRVQRDGVQEFVFASHVQGKL